VDDETFGAAKHLMLDHAGAAPVVVQVGSDNGEQAPRLKSRSLRVSPDAETIEGLQKLFGHGNVRIVRMFSAAIPEHDPVRNWPGKDWGQG
jgi:hypothetical protein